MKLKQLIKSSAVYGILNFLPLASRFFLFPIFVNILSPYDYGILGLHATMMQFFFIFILMGLDNTFARYYYDFNNEKDQLASLFSTMLLSVLFLGIIIITAFQIFGTFIYSIVFTDEGYSFLPFGNYSLISAFLRSISAIILVFLRNENNLKQYFILAGGSFLLSLLFETITIFFISADAESVLAARNLGLSVFSLFFCFKYLIKFRFKFDATHLRKTIRYTFSFVPYTLLGFGYLYLDRIMIENLLSIERLAIYGVAFTIASVMETFINALDQAIVPEVFGLLKDGKSKNTGEINQILKISAVLVILVACIILALSPLFIHNFVPATYLEALTYIPLFIIAFSVRFYYGLYSKFIFYYPQATRFLPIINLTATVTTFLNLVFIPELNLFGAAIVMILTRLSLLPIAMYLERKFVKFDFSLGKTNIGFFIITILCLIMSLSPDDVEFKWLIFLAPFCIIITLLISAFVKGGFVITKSSLTAFMKSL